MCQIHKCDTRHQTFKERRSLGAQRRSEKWERECERRS